MRACVPLLWASMPLCKASQRDAALCLSARVAFDCQSEAALARELLEMLCYVPLQPSRLPVPSFGQKTFLVQGFIVSSGAPTCVCWLSPPPDAGEICLRVLLEYLWSVLLRSISECRLVQLARDCWSAPAAPRGETQLGASSEPERELVIFMSISLYSRRAVI